MKGDRGGQKNSIKSRRGGLEARGEGCKTKENKNEKRRNLVRLREREREGEREWVLNSRPLTDGWHLAPHYLRK